MRPIPLLFAVSFLATPFVANAAWQPETEPNDSADEAQSLDGYFDLSFNPLIGENNPLADNLPVYNSTDDPHAEITGLSEVNVSWSEFPSPDPGKNTFDWYSFTITTPGSVGIIDIDCAWQNEEDECGGSGLMGQFDAFVQLFDTDGTTRLTDTTGGDDDSNAVFGIFDAPQDPGSNGDISIRPEGELRLASRDSFIVYTFDEPGTYFVRVGSFGGEDADDMPIQQPPVGDYLLHVSIISPGDCSARDAALNAAGCNELEFLDRVGDEIRALMGSAGWKARRNLERALRTLQSARARIARGQVERSLRTLARTVWSLRAAGWRGVDASAPIKDLVDYARAKAYSAIDTASSSRNKRDARRQMERAERALRYGYPGVAVWYCANAWAIASRD